ncbi:MAG: AraC family transcriptional regulator [Bacteroidetes bacterium GWF2_41_31]|nr:MAG: AraC family transcriptional regulator [Bacteroidetes bacterium GWF2_41_31]OFZ08064.1 MAG: AraC family transcriptional regulator [Bacteroidetes bacterium RIFOXYB12_FULL_41_6]
MILEHKNYLLFGRMIFEKVVIKPPFQKSNIMPEEACFFYIIEGRGEAVSEVEHLKIPVQESVLMKCGNYITRMIPTPASNTFHTVVVHFHPEILKKVYENDLPKFLLHPRPGTTVGMSKVKSSILIDKYIESLLFYFENPELVNEDLLVLKLKEIILLLTQTDDSPAINQILTSLFSPSTYSFTQIVDAHLYSNLSGDDLAQLTNLSLSSFKREFKRVYNDSPANFIKNKKLEKAAELLLVSNERITDIAYDTGFNNLAHFSKSFQEKHGQPPSVYRMSQKHK